jgi:membrane protease YdiL (CAAX protease family)
MKHLPTVVGLAVAIGGPPALAAWGERILGDSALMSTRIAGQAALCAFAGVVLAIVVGWERMPLASIGLRAPDWKTAASGIALAAAFVFAIGPFALRVVSWSGLPGFAGPFAANLGSMPRWYLVMAAVIGGTVEELLYRGYAVERLAALTSSYAVAGAMVVVAFSLAHLPFWGPGPSLSTLITGAVLTAFYIWRRDVLANAIAHALTGGPASARIRSA